MKKPIYAAIIFGISLQILYFSIACDKKPDSEMKKSGHKSENNKILEKYQKKLFIILSNFYLYTIFNLCIK